MGASSRRLDTPAKEAGYSARTGLGFCRFQIPPIRVHPEILIGCGVLISWANEPITLVYLFVIPA